MECGLHSTKHIGQAVAQPAGAGVMLLDLASILQSLERVEEFEADGQIRASVTALL